MKSTQQHDCIAIKSPLISDIIIITITITITIIISSSSSSSPHLADSHDA